MGRRASFRRSSRRSLRPRRGRGRGFQHSSGRIEIVLSRGRRVIVDADVDAEALSRIVDVLERR